jgi:hypothetical protein
MANRRTQPASDQRRHTPQLPIVETDFEALIAAAIAAVVVKPSKRSRKPRPQPRVLGKFVEYISPGTSSSKAKD